jgi:hypothetical protein
MSRNIEIDFVKVLKIAQIIFDKINYLQKKTPQIT